LMDFRLEPTVMSPDSKFPRACVDSLLANCDHYQDTYQDDLQQKLNTIIYDAYQFETTYTKAATEIVAGEITIKKIMKLFIFSGEVAIQAGLKSRRMSVYWMPNYLTCILKTYCLFDIMDWGGWNIFKDMDVITSDKMKPPKTLWGFCIYLKENGTIRSKQMGTSYHTTEEGASLAGNDQFEDLADYYHENNLILPTCAIAVHQLRITDKD
jgi:hypothetical protein